MEPIPDPVCKNCGATLVGPYCAQCGQKEADSVKPLTALISDFFDGTFSLDSRVVRTTGHLLTAPGRLTRVYFDGQRLRYLPPVRLFLVCSLIFFATVGFSGRHLLRITAVPLHADTDLILGWQDDDSASNTSTDTATTSERPDGYQASLVLFPSADEPVQGGLPPKMVEELLADRDLPPIVGEILRSFQTAISEPQAFNQQLNVWLPRMMFIMVPVFGLIVRLFYWRERLFYAHHVIFALHYHSFAFVLLTLLIALVPLYGGTVAAIVFAIASNLYILTSMKTTYQQSWRTTVAKWFGISSLYGFTFFLTLQATLYGVMRQL